MLRRKQLIIAVMWLPQRLRYNPSNMKRARITLVGEKATNQKQRHAKAPIRVNISPILHELEFQITSLPPLLAGHLPDATSRLGSIEFSSTHAGRFCVDWNQHHPGILQCSISANLQPGDYGMIQERTVPDVDLEFESRDACMTTPLEQLYESENVLLGVIETARLKAWISVSREIFIGRSRFELNIDAKLVTLKNNKESSAPPTRIRDMWAKQVPSLVGVGDGPLRLPHRQRDQEPPAKEERKERKIKASNEHD